MTLVLVLPYTTPLPIVGQYLLPFAFLCCPVKHLTPPVNPFNPDSGSVSYFPQFGPSVQDPPDNSLLSPSEYKAQ